MEAEPTSRRGSELFEELGPLGGRRIVSIGGSVFRVWVDRPGGAAEFFKDGEWVWTPIPSESVLGHPRARELSPEEVRGLYSR